MSDPSDLFFLAYQGMSRGSRSNIDHMDTSISFPSIPGAMGIQQCPPSPSSIPHSTHLLTSRNQLICQSCKDLQSGDFDFDEHDTFDLYAVTSVAIPH